MTWKIATTRMINYLGHQRFGGVFSLLVQGKAGKPKSIVSSYV